MSESFHHQALAAGYQLHWYRIESVLGQGGFGITYLATDTNLAQAVAIKEFLPADLAVRIQDSTVQPVSHDRSDTFGWGLSCFLSEARTLAKFRHPNIVRVYSVFEANGTAYMVMEYEKGVSLEDALRSRRVEGEHALVSVVHALMDGLELVHEAGFVHRDIKPDNIFMRSSDAVPVLLDFGSARQAIGVATRTLTSLVTPGYAPFEQYNSTRENDRQGPWTDIYSLAATLYRGITGKGPIDALTRADVLLTGGEDPLVPLSSVAPAGFSPALLDAVDAGLAFQPQNRPQSLAEWRSLLPARPTTPHFAAASEQAMPTSPAGSDEVTEIRAPRPAPDAATVRGPAIPPASGAAPTRPTRGRGRSVAITALLIVLLAAGGGGTWWLLSRPQVPVAPAPGTTADLPRADATPTPPPAAVAPDAADETARLGQERDRVEAQRRAIEEERARLALEEQRRQVEQMRREAEDARAANEAARAEGADAEARAAEQARAEQEAAEARAAEQARAEKEAAEARAAEQARAEQEAAEARAAEQARAEKEAAEARAAEQARAEQEAAEARAAEQARAEKEAAEARAAEQARAEQEAAEARAAEQARAEKEAAEARAAEQARAAERARDEQVRDLLEAASADVAALRLTSPPGRNAYERYRAVLAIDADNAEALAGLERIVSRYLALASEAADTGDFPRGASMLDRASRVSPDDARVAMAREALEARRAEVAAREAERRAREEAEAKARAEAEAQALASARPAPSAVERDIRWKEAEGTGCLVWNEKPRQQETVSWSGACVDGKASGRGELVWNYVADGKALEQRYVGSMRGGKLHGQGVVSVSNGARYEGELRNDMRHGQGTFTAPNGARYVGQWRENERSGRGVQSWPDGGRYDGEWQRNRFHGQGALTYSNGGQYEGQFFNDKRHGRGVLTWASGARYEGEWKDDKRDGRGTVTRPGGDRYEGEWRADAPHGTGVAVIDGTRYSGQWSNGCMRDGGESARWGKTPAECGF